MSKVSDQPRVAVPRQRRQPDVGISLLGTFELDVEGAGVSLPTAAQRLVAVLALRGRTGRSRLAGLLWPETTEPRALASLRTGIWRVNQVAAGLVESGHGVVQLGLRPRIDVVDLIAASRAVLDDGEHPSSLPIAAVESEAELLADWDDPWLGQERERLRQLQLHVLEATAAQLTRAGRFGLALEAALAALRIDDLRESAYRAVIAVHLEEGNLREARRTFDVCRRTFRAELDIEPSRDLGAMVAVVTDGAERRSDAPVIGIHAG